MKLHLGCGERYLNGYVHVDIAEFDHIDFIRPVDDLSCFKKNTVSEIYASHVLEYFDREYAPEVLNEWKRVLKPNGILAVVSFHSLEDRIVKQFLINRSQHAARPSRHLPIVNGAAPSFDLVARKAVLPSKTECRINSRARSAKLRIARRTNAPVYMSANQETAACG